MTAWVAPITFSSGSALTAAQLNSEIRDHAVWLKAGLDLITESSAADSGTATYLYVKRTATTDGSFATRATGDANYRLMIRASGKIEWGDGTAAFSENLYHRSSGELATDSYVSVGATGVGLRLDPSGEVLFNERTDPGAPGANQTFLYTRDNGAGKTQLCAVFATGAVQVIATQP